MTLIIDFFSSPASAIFMAAAYIMLVVVLSFVLVRVWREANKPNAYFPRLKWLSLSLVLCLLLDSFYWAVANIHRVSAQVPASALPYWNNLSIIIVKGFVLFGALICLRLVRNSFKEAYKASYGAAINESNDAIGVLNKDGTVFYWNKAMYTMFEYNSGSEPAEGRSIEDLIIYGPDMEEERSAFREATKNLAEKIIPKDTSLVRRKTKNGRIKVVSISMSRRETDSGKFEGCFGIIKEGRDTIFPWCGNRMAGKLHLLKELLKPTNLVCTVLVADIVKSSKLIDSDPPNALGFLSDYFRRMVGIIDSHEGLVVDVVGDEILALFGILDGTDRSKQYRSVAAAIRAAREMQSAYHNLLHSYEIHRTQSGGGKIDSSLHRLGIAINTGYLLVGTLQAEWLQHFTAVGTPVTVAKQFEGYIHLSHAVPDLLISGATYSCLSQTEHSSEFVLCNLELLGISVEQDSQRIYCLETNRTYNGTKKDGIKGEKGKKPNLVTSESNTAIDVAILIALEEEFKVLYQYVRDQLHGEHEHNGRVYYPFLWPGLENRAYHCVATIGGMGEKAAALATRDILSHWNPTTLVVLGIAGTLDDEVKVGDVVVGTIVESYLDHAKIIESKKHGWEFVLAGEPYRLNDKLISQIGRWRFMEKETLHIQWQKDCKAYLESVIGKDHLASLQQQGIVGVEPTIREGVIASGSSVITSQAFKEFLKSKGNRKFLAIEMESGGVLAANSGNSACSCLILRAISDPANPEKHSLDRIVSLTQPKGPLRHCAMSNAVKLLLALMRVDILPRHSSIQ